MSDDIKRRIAAARDAYAQGEALREWLAANNMADLGNNAALARDLANDVERLLEERDRSSAESVEPGQDMVEVLLEVEYMAEDAFDRAHGGAGFPPWDALWKFNVSMKQVRCAGIRAVLSSLAGMGAEALPSVADMHGAAAKVWREQPARNDKLVAEAEACANFVRSRVAPIIAAKDERIRALEHERAIVDEISANLDKTNAPPGLLADRVAWACARVAELDEAQSKLSTANELLDRERFYAKGQTQQRDMAEQQAAKLEKQLAELEAKTAELLSLRERVAVLESALRSDRSDSR